MSQEGTDRTDAPVIRCRGLGKVYRSGFFRIPYTGLESLDLDVYRGEVFGFIGPNGAGKTTTIKILMGLQSATSGTASLLGVDHREPRSKERVGFLPERPYFYQHLTAREFLHFYGALFDIPKAVRVQRIGALLERVQLDRFADVPLGSYSKGMLQRAGVAQALINDPELVVMDEPMSGLDPMGRMLIRDIIFEERDAGRTVFFSSHILADVELICDRVAILVNGRLRGCGTMAELVGDRVRHVDIAFRLATEPPADLPGEALRREGEAVIQRVAPDQVDLALDRIRAAGGSVLSVQQAKEQLEDVLLDEVERAAPVDRKRLGVLT
ncbi:MAG: ABC transporter ATP-binding protein [Alphaproteobacteria bacterium]|nr:ABC transporter ATP-binding protein [Alphaproteobacteria bacterium]